MNCFSNFDRVRGWFDTEFQDSDGFTVSSTCMPGHNNVISSFRVNLVGTISVVGLWMHKLMT